MTFTERVEARGAIDKFDADTPNRMGDLLITNLIQPISGNALQ